MVKNPEKSQKILKIHFFIYFFILKFFFLVKKNYILLFFKCQEDAILPDLSSPARFRNMKISKNLKNSLFLFFIFWRKKMFAEKKKCYSLIFPISGGRDSTRPLQSSPFQKYENIKKSQKFTFLFLFFEKQKNFAGKKEMLSS